MAVKLVDNHRGKETLVEDSDVDVSGGHYVMAWDSTHAVYR